MFSVLFARLKEKKPEPELEKRPSEKSKSSEQFIKSPETQKFISKWMKKNYTKRGITKLLMRMWLLSSSDKKALKAAEEILSALIGMDGLSKVLGALKLVSEGIMKKVS